MKQTCYQISELNMRSDFCHMWREGGGKIHVDVNNPISVHVIRLFLASCSSYTLLLAACHSQHCISSVIAPVGYGDGFQDVTPMAAKCPPALLQLQAHRNSKHLDSCYMSIHATIKRHLRARPTSSRSPATLLHPETTPGSAPTTPTCNQDLPYAGVLATATSRSTATLPLACSMHIIPSATLDDCHT